MALGRIILMIPDSAQLMKVAFCKSRGQSIAGAVIAGEGLLARCLDPIISARYQLNGPDAIASTYGGPLPAGRPAGLGEVNRSEV